MFGRWLAIGLALAATPAAAQKPAPPPASPPAFQESIDNAVWEGTAASGPIVHRVSGVTLPDSIGNFRRFRAGGQSSTDVFANYRHSRNGRETIVTVFLFRPGALPEHRLPVAAAAIGVRSPHAFLWMDGPFSIGSSPQLRAYKATFKTGWGPNTMMDYLYFAPLGQWTVKVRASVDSPTDIEDEREVDALVRALPWEQILRAAGECAGWACDTQSAFPFNSQSREMDELFGTDAATPVYTHGGYRLVPYTQDRAADYFAMTFGAIDVREPLYAVEMDDKGSRRVVRYYSGLPTEEQFRRTVDALREHPEPSAIVSPLQAAYHLEQFDQRH